MDTARSSSIDSWITGKTLSQLEKMPWLVELFREYVCSIPATLVTHDRHNEASEERQAGVGDGGIVLVGDAAVVAEDLAFFGLDQSQQTVDR